MLGGVCVSISTPCMFNKQMDITAVSAHITNTLDICSINDCSDPWWLHSLPIGRFGVQFLPIHNFSSQTFRGETSIMGQKYDDAKERRLLLEYNTVINSNNVDERAGLPPRHRVIVQGKEPTHDTPSFGPEVPIVYLSSDELNSKPQQNQKTAASPSTVLNVYRCTVHYPPGNVYYIHDIYRTLHFN